MAMALPPIACAASAPAYIDTAANHLTYYDGSLDKVRGALDALSAGSDTVVRVLHIGDSHIQAEMVTNELRRLLQERYGNAGRGLVAPLRLAGTNQSHDYTMTLSPADSAAVLRQTRLLKYPWPVTPGVTGIAILPEGGEEVTVVAETKASPDHVATRATALTSRGAIAIDSCTDGSARTHYKLAPGEAFYGMILENGRKGLLYSAIGNNGACFTDYSLIPSFAKTTAVFRPNLIILSMGTNEGFSIMSDEEISRSVKGLVRSLRAYNPDADFLILTPMECQKNRRHGKKPLSPYFDVNKRVAEARELILEAAREEKVPVWDFYEVAGGAGASSRWLDDGLMNKDRIHLLRPGYELQAQLLFNALTEAFDTKTFRTNP